jgi:hypothetical protein
MKRRMIAADVVSEGKFLRMSLTAQALYMHLVANADDDGCVDAYTILRMIGAKEDDLLLLREREYITILDEKEWILWVTGWQDFNWIDARIKEDSKWLPLLRSKVEGLQIVSSTKREANRRRYAKLKLERDLKKNDPHVDHMMITGESPENHMPRIGKDRVGKERKDKSPKALAPAEPAPTGEEAEFSFWFEKTGTHIRSKLKENVAAAHRLKAALEPQEFIRAVETIRLIRADRYAGKNLQVVGNYVQLERNLEAIEAYRRGLEDRGAFQQKTDASKPKVTRL